MQSLPGSRRKIGSRFFALLAIQMGTQVLFTSSDSEHPRAIREWRLVPYVLSMTTGQIGNPVALFILVISDDRLLHSMMIHVSQTEGTRDQSSEHVTICSLQRSVWHSSRLPFLERQLRSLSSGKIPPVFCLILIETSDKYDVSIERTKFREVRAAVL